MEQPDKYKELAKLFYQDASSSRMRSLEAEYEKRFNADSTFRLGFDTPNGELFIAVPRQLSILTQQVLRAERNIAGFLDRLPATASNAILKSFVLDEVVSNNAIENIGSTRQQIKAALDSPANAPRKTRRFREMATLYLGLIDGGNLLPASADDIRAIYDQVTAGEIAPDNMPDGRLFRTREVGIIQNGDKVIHTGVQGEHEITAGINAMLGLMHDEEIPELYAAVASHFLFEYIHPFYDGNGRTGRYLLTLMLSKSLSPATSLSLSRIIAENRSSYYKAFKTAESKLNKGELTFFIITMLELIREAQIQILIELDEAFDILSQLDAMVNEMRESRTMREKELEIVSLLMQMDAFGLFGELPLREIAEYLGLKEQMARKHLVSLEVKGIVEKVRKRNPVTFALTQEFKTDISQRGASHSSRNWL